MAKRKNKDSEMPATTSPKRTGRNVNAWVDPDIWSALEAYFRSLELRPTTTQVIELALKEFLDKRGFWPPEDND